MTADVSGVARALRRAAGVLTLGLVAASLPAACGDSGGPQAAPAAAVRLSDTTVTLRVGDDASVTATARDASGQPLDGRRIFWSSRDTTVATVSQAGVVRGVAPGATQISANVEGQSAVATVAVLSRPVVALTVDPATAQLVVGRTQQLTARAATDRGTVVATPVTWTSVTPSVVTVSGSGLVTAVGPGVGSVRATTDALSATAVLVVVPVPVASVRVTPAAAAVAVGASQQLTATPLDSAGAALAGRAVVWTSQAPGVAAVSSSGLLTGVAPGTAAVTATVEGRAAEVTVTVTPAAVAAVTVVPAASSVGVGGTVALSAVVADANGTALAGRAVAWTSSAPAVATVSAEGVVTGVGAGTATITATSERVSGTATVRVVVPPAATVASVSVSPPSVTIVAGTTLQLTATARAGDGAVITGRPVAWSSSAPAVLTVTAAGQVAAVAPGTATVTATVDGITGTSVVSVQRAPVASVVVAPSPASVAAGGTLQLAATPRDANGGALAGRSVTWASSNTAVATVSSAGLVTGVAPGSATLTATSEGVTGTTALTVTPVVRVTPAADTIRVAGPPSGRVTQLVATDHAGRTLTPSQVTWASSNPAVATVSATGLVAAVSAPGGGATVTITASAPGAAGTAQIRVTP